MLLEVGVPEEVAEAVVHVGGAEEAVGEQDVGVGAQDDVGAGVGQELARSVFWSPLGQVWPSVPQWM